MSMAHVPDPSCGRVAGGLASAVLARSLRFLLPALRAGRRAHHPGQPRGDGDRAEARPCRHRRRRQSVSPAAALQSFITPANYIGYYVGVLVQPAHTLDATRPRRANLECPDLVAPPSGRNADVA